MLLTSARRRITTPGRLNLLTSERRLIPPGCPSATLLTFLSGVSDTYEEYTRIENLAETRACPSATLLIIFLVRHTRA